MLTIRRAQLDELQRQLDQQLPQRVMGHLRARCPRHTDLLSDADLRAKVEIGLARARYYGIEAPSQLASFVGLMFVVGPGFDEHPWIRRILRNTRMEPGARLDAVVRTTPRRIWEEARRAAETAEWQDSPAGVSNDSREL